MFERILLGNFLNFQMKTLKKRIFECLKIFLIKSKNFERVSTLKMFTVEKQKLLQLVFYCISLYKKYRNIRFEEFDLTK